MLCLVLTGLVINKNIIIEKQLMLHRKVWKEFCLEVDLHKQFFPSFLSDIIFCVGSGEAKHTDFGPFGDDCKAKLC